MKNIWRKLSVAQKKISLSEIVQNNSGIQFKRRLEKIRKEYAFFALIGISLFAVIVPLYREGIMCNDELQSRLYSYRGIFVFLKHFFEVHAYEKGRALSSVIASITMYFGFLGQSHWTYKIVQILIILLDIGVFGALINKIFLDPAFSLFCCVSILSFLPISFEHTAPNAFVTLYGIPLAMLFWSMILYWNWLKGGHRRTLIGSMILFFIAACSYEAFLTFAPVYALLAIYQYGLKTVIHQIKYVLWPIVASISFLVAYVISGKYLPSQYAGNAMIIPNPVNALNIIADLVRSSFPGYFLFLPKYCYVFDLYADITLDDILRVSLVIVGFTTVMSKLYICEKRGNLRVSIVISTLLIIALPTFPYAMSELYQNAVGGEGNLALPVTYFSFFPATFLCCYLIWQFIKVFPHKAIMQAIILCLALLLIPVQIMNGEFSSQIQKNFQRLEYMEDFIKSPFMQSSENLAFSSTDLFETRNALAFHDSYWNEYAEACGRSIQISRRESTEKEWRIFFDDVCFYIWAENELCVVSKDDLPQAKAVPYLKGKFLLANCDKSALVEGWNCCFFRYADNMLLPSSIDKYFNQVCPPGQTLASCIKVEGYFDDGWTASKSSFVIKSGESGTISVQGYAPIKVQEVEEIECYIDGVRVLTYSLDGEEIDFSVPCVSSSVVELTFQTNFSFRPDNGDLRELSFLLSGLEGK